MSKWIELGEICQLGVANEVFPGCAFALFQEGELRLGAVGRATYSPESEAINPDTVYDLASLTKVIFTTPWVQRAVNEGKIELDDFVTNVIPEYPHPITFRQLLLHRSGLPAHRLYSNPKDFLTEPLIHAIGHLTEYSCIGFMVLHEALERLYGRREALYGGFQFAASASSPPTEVTGVVHDENARMMGGYAGNAGLFGSVTSCANFCLEQLKAGKTEWNQAADQLSSRALGWDTKAGRYGHTGFTGTSLWMSPDQQRFAVHLSNRVYPSRENTKILAFRDQFYEAAFREE